MQKSFVALCASFLILTACNTDGRSGTPNASDTDYLDLQQGVIGNGEASILFFFEEESLMSMEKDTFLTDWYGSLEIPVKTYRVDFNTEEGLKRKYSIVRGDSFVLIDGSGKAISTEISPSLSQLKRLLYLNIDSAKEKDVEESEESEEAEEPEAVMENDPEATMKQNAPEKVMAAAGQYTQYVDGVIGNGQPSVLFFHAKWCPACKANNEKLVNWYENNKFSRSVYKLDFDTETALRSKYGVTGQDTFILIDGSGKEIERVSFPSEKALRGLLG